MLNIMLDLETMGMGCNSAIVAIGAVEFTEDLGITSRFYKTVDLQSCLDKGLDITGATVMWWMKQSEEARRSICENNISLEDALKTFHNWISKGKDDVQIWGNGAAFDNAILKNAYSKFKIDNPWPHWSDRCYLTIKNSFSYVESKQRGTFHNALNNANYQANHLLQLIKVHKLRDILCEQYG